MKADSLRRHLGRWRFVGALALLLLAGAAASQEPLTLKSPKDRLSYALGLDLGQQLRRQSVNLDPAIFARGLGDGLAGGQTLLTEAQVRATIAALQEELQRRAAGSAAAAQPGAAAEVQEPPRKTP